MRASSAASGRAWLGAILLWILALLTPLSIFSAPSLAQNSDLVNGPVNPASRVVLRGQRAPWALAQNSVGPVPGDTALEHLTLVLRRSPQQQKAFELFLQQLQDPSSPNYHRWLTPVQVGKRFGVSQHDIGAVTGWLVGQGLRVRSVANSRMMIDFGGNASLVGAAFGTEMRYYLMNGEQRMAAAKDPQIPAALAGVIQSVRGLNTVNDRPYHGAGQVEVSAEGAELPAISICNAGSCHYYITPADFAVIYDANTAYQGLGQTIAIIGRSRVYTPDLTNFESLTGVTFSDPTVIVPPNGQDPGPPAGTGGLASDDQLEATLDVMRAASVAPGATIDLIVSTSNGGGIGIATEYAVDTNPVPAQIMNISFGACEFDRSLSDVQFWDTLFSQGAAEGISTFVASGDAGAAGCDSYFQPPPAQQTASPNYICSSSYSTCVGGTEFADTANPSLYWSQSSSNAPPFESALRYIPEGGWNEPSYVNKNNQTVYQAAASGGGFSSYIATPSWQTGTGVPGTQGRYTPDIAFSASAHDGYFGCLAAGGGDCVVQNGRFGFEYFYGSSAAAPDMAGITALLNQKLGGPQGELNQRLYQLAANPANRVFNDVTVASSGVSGCALTTPSMCNNSTPSTSALTGGLSGYLVTAGFDEVTGWGSIDVGNLLANFGAGTTTSVSSSLNPAKLGVAVTFTATVATTGSNPPTGMVTFSDGNTAIGSGTLNGSLMATFSSSTLAGGTHSITAVYGGDTNNAPSTSPVLNQTIIPPTFNWAANGSTSGSVLSGQTATYNFTATPTGGAAGFAANVTFSCSGLPDATVTCSFNPSQIAVGTLGATPVRLTISTKGPNTPAGSIRRPVSEKRVPLLPLALPLVGMVLVGFCGRKLSKHFVIGGLCLSLALLGLMVACGGTGGGSTPTPVTVTPASARVSLGGTQQFSASTSVTWSLSGGAIGSISSSGLYTAPSAGTTPASITVTATPQTGTMFTAGTAAITIPAVGVTVNAGTPASVYPNNATDHWPNQTAQFTATVTNASSTAVTWAVTTANGGTIDANGLYTAPTVAAGLPASVTIKATAQADTTQSGSAVEMLTPATVPGTYSNIMVTATESTTVNSAPVTLTVN